MARIPILWNFLQKGKTENDTFVYNEKFQLFSRVTKILIVRRKETDSR